MLQFLRSFLAFALVALATPAIAQSAVVVADCAPGANYTAGQSRPLTMDTRGNLCGADTATGPARGLIAITPADGTAITACPGSTYPTSLYVGGAGNIAIRASGDTVAVTLVGVAAGQFIPVRAIRVLSTGTTATNIVGLCGG